MSTPFILSFTAIVEGRLDQLVLEALRKDFPELSRTRLKEAFQAEQVEFNGRPAPGSLHLLAGNYEVRILGWDPGQAVARIARPSLQGAFLSVVFEDEDLLVLHKESGVPSVPLEPEETETAVGAALAHCPELAQFPNGGLEPGLLHRLDTGTSGLLAFAKTESEFNRLRHFWRSRMVQKTYRAIVSPDITQAVGPVDLTPALPNGPPLMPPSLEPRRISFPIAHDGKSAKRMRVLVPGAPHREIRGNPLEATTWILEVMTPPSRVGYSPRLDVVLEIETGVMHQIRCHLAALGYPIVGDSLYGTVNASRLALHAWKLNLPMKTGGQLLLEADLPPQWPWI